MSRLRQDINIGSQIRALRMNCSMTQDQVVTRLQLDGSVTTRSIYSRYETGELNIKISDLVMLKNIFKCSFDDFFIGL